MDWASMLKVEGSGMVASEEWITLEDLYKKFKARMLSEQDELEVKNET